MKGNRPQEASEGFSAGKLYLTLLAVALAVFCTAGFTRKGHQDQLERGRYIVQQVGLCGDCHTPRDNKGMSVEANALEGAPILFKPTIPMPKWGEIAPPIAGLPGFTDDQAITFLTTGKDTSGKYAAPPMPPYRLSRSDAEAVVAYLRSVSH
jgi:mono/diheme cytochrome c family protein